MLEQKDYQDIKHLVEPGDVIAFGGTSLFSRWTKFTTRSVVTHTALVIDAPTLHRSPDEPKDVTMIEATSMKGKKGVMNNYLGERIKNYRGDVWWLPLHDDAKSHLATNWQPFHNFLAKQLGKSYDIWQLFGSAIDTFDDHRLLSWLTYNRKKMNKWFCSELVAEGLRYAGITSDLNPSETTPRDISQFSIFKPEYVQLKGKRRLITDFNTLNPQGWGKIG